MSEVVYAGPPPEFSVATTDGPRFGVPISAKNKGNGQGIATLACTWCTVFVLILVAAHSYALPEYKSSLAWMNDVEDGLAVAGANDQLVLVAFTTSSCPACVQMEREVLSTDAFGKALSDWAAVRINPGWNARTASKYKVKAVPSFVILSPRGEVLDVSTGTRPLASFLGWLDRTEANWRHRQAATTEPASSP